MIETKALLEKKWWLIKCKPNKDNEAEQNLVNQEYTIYRPMTNRIVKQRGKMVKKQESLFPGYIFVELDRVNDNWGSINSTFGVSHYVKFGNRPAEVQANVINQLKLDEARYVKKVVEMDKFKKGQKVLIEDGPFVGLEGVFDIQDSEQRSMILIDFLHKTTRLPIETAKLRKV